MIMPNITISSIAPINLKMFSSIFSSRGRRDKDRFQGRGRRNSTLQRRWVFSSLRTFLAWWWSYTYSLTFLARLVRGNACHQWWLQAYQPEPWMTFATCVEQKYPSLDFTLPGVEDDLQHDCWCEHSLTTPWQNMYSSVQNWNQGPVNCCEYSRWTSFCDLDCAPDCNDERARQCQQKCSPLCLENRYRAEQVNLGLSVCDCEGCWDKIRCLHDHAQNKTRADFQRVCHVEEFERSQEASNWFACAQRYPHSTVWEQARARAHCICEADIHAASVRHHCCGLPNHKELCEDVHLCAPEAKKEFCNTEKAQQCLFDCAALCDHIQTSSDACKTKCLDHGSECAQYQRCEPNATTQHDYVCDDGVSKPDIGGCCTRHDVHMATAGNLWCPRFCGSDEVWWVRATDRYECDCGSCPATDAALKQTWRSLVAEHIENRYRKGLVRILQRLELESNPDHVRKLEKLWQVMLDNAVTKSAYEPGRAVTDLHPEVSASITVDLESIEVEALSLWNVDQGGAAEVGSGYPPIAGAWIMDDAAWEATLLNPSTPVPVPAPTPTAPAPPPAGASVSPAPTPPGGGVVGGAILPGGATSGNSGDADTGKINPGGSSGSGVETGEGGGPYVIPDDFASSPGGNEQDDPDVYPTPLPSGGSSNSGPTPNPAPPPVDETLVRVVGRTQFQMNLPAYMTGASIMQDNGLVTGFQTAFAKQFAVEKWMVQISSFQVRSISMSASNALRTRSRRRSRRRNEALVGEGHAKVEDPIADHVEDEVAAEMTVEALSRQPLSREPLQLLEGLDLSVGQARGSPRSGDFAGAGEKEKRSRSPVRRVLQASSRYLTVSYEITMPKKTTDQETEHALQAILDRGSSAEGIELLESSLNEELKNRPAIVLQRVEGVFVIDCAAAVLQGRCRIDIDVAESCVAECRRQWDQENQQARNAPIFVELLGGRDDSEDGASTTLILSLLGFGGLSAAMVVFIAKLRSRQKAAEVAEEYNTESTVVGRPVYTSDYDYNTPHIPTGTIITGEESWDIGGSWGAPTGRTGPKIPEMVTYTVNSNGRVVSSTSTGGGGGSPPPQGTAGGGGPEVDEQSRAKLDAENKEKKARASKDKPAAKRNNFMEPGAGGDETPASSNSSPFDPFDNDGVAPPTVKPPTSPTKKAEAAGTTKAGPAADKDNIFDASTTGETTASTNDSSRSGSAGADRLSGGPAPPPSSAAEEVRRKVSKEARKSENGLGVPLYGDSKKVTGRSAATQLLKEGGSRVRESSLPRMSSLSNLISVDRGPGTESQLVDADNLVATRRENEARNHILAVLNEVQEGGNAVPQTRKTYRASQNSVLPSVDVTTAQPAEATRTSTGAPTSDVRTGRSLRPRNSSDGAGASPQRGRIGRQSVTPTTAWGPVT